MFDLTRLTDTPTMKLDSEGRSKALNINLKKRKRTRNADETGINIST